MPLTVHVFKDGRDHALLLAMHGFCIDCRFCTAGRCELFGVRAGSRPAVCLAAEGESKARNLKGLAEREQQ